MKYSDLMRGGAGVQAAGIEPPKLNLQLKVVPVGGDLQDFENRVNDWLLKVQEKYEAVMIHEKGFFVNAAGEQFFLFWYGYRER